MDKRGQRKSIHYQRYTATKLLFLPRDRASKVWPKLCQSMINADRFRTLTHFTAINVGTEGGFC